MGGRGGPLGLYRGAFRVCQQSRVNGDLRLPALRQDEVLRKVVPLQTAAVRLGGVFLTFLDSRVRLDEAGEDTPGG